MLAQLGPLNLLALTISFVSWSFPVKINQNGEMAKLRSELYYIGCITNSDIIELSKYYCACIGVKLYVSYVMYRILTVCSGPMI